MGIDTNELSLQEHVKAVMVNFNTRKYWDLGQHKNSLLLLPIAAWSTFFSYVGYEFGNVLNQIWLKDNHFQWMHFNKNRC